MKAQPFQLLDAVLATLLCLATLPASAQYTPAPSFIFVTNHGVLTITGYTAPAYTAPGGNVDIPDSTTGISSNAFEHCNPTSVTIPASITNIGEGAYRAGARRYFFSSSACAYNTLLQPDPKVRALKESDAYPALAERGYGWEKLISGQFCEEYWHERGMKTAIARFHNVYGPHGTWDGGREKAPAALCRKVIEAIETGKQDITIWGNGEQTRSFMYIADCVQGIDKIMHCDELIATPINLGSSELGSVNELLTKIEKIAGVKMNRKYDLNAPQGVAGRNSDNTFIKKTLKWEPNTKLDQGLAETYAWIKQQYKKRQAGERVGIG